MFVQGEPIAIAEDPSLSGINVPIPATDPVVRFPGVSVSGPFRKFDIELMIELLEDLFADHSPVVVAPARNLWIEKSNKIFLRGRLVAANALGQLLVMTLDGVCTWFDQGLKASSCARVELAHSILTNREAQAVEARCTCFVEKRVGNASFLQV